jgi:hypothetical protein
MSSSPGLFHDELVERLGLDPGIGFFRQHPAADIFFDHSSAAGSCGGVALFGFE